jgi:hypothetical protein
MPRVKGASLLSMTPMSKAKAVPGYACAVISISLHNGAAPPLGLSTAHCFSCKMLWRLQPSVKYV